MRKRERLDPADIASYNDLNDQVEALKANIDYIHENIQECQENIMSMEESKVIISLLQDGIKYFLRILMILYLEDED